MSDSFLLPLIERLSIADKFSSIIPLRPNWAQRIAIEEVEKALRAGVPIRLIALKARQLGFSTIAEAIIYCLCFLYYNSSGLVIADEVDNANHLLGMTDLYWETDPLKPLYTTKYQAKNTLAWRETRSAIRTTTAGNKKAGRSRTIRYLHASEVAFWDNAETVSTGLMQAIPTAPRTLITLESTANGRGNYFHKMWQQAILGESEYVPLFFPWWMHYEYRASFIKLPHRPLGDLDEEEKVLLRLFDEGLRVGDRLFKIPPTEWEDALGWRRWAIWNLLHGDLIKFHQEYPSTPEEAFVATGTNVFPQQHLLACFDERHGKKGRLVRRGASVEFIDDLGGPLTIYKYPSTNRELGHYVIGGDSTATIKGDFAVAQVLNRRTMEQVAILRQRIDPAHFGEELAKLGIYYNTALLAPENEGPGYATVGWLMQLDYPNMFQSTMADNLPGRFTGKYGWSSSYRSKDLAVGWLLRLLIERGTKFHDRKTFEEMDNYVTLEGGGYGNGAAEGHDDTVMAYAIAVTASIQWGALPSVGAMPEMAGMMERGQSRDPEDPPWVNWNTETLDLIGGSY